MGDARLTSSQAHRDLSGETGQAARTEQQLRADLIAGETAELARLYDAGTISAGTRWRLQLNLDLETTRLTEGPH